jgi:hypothetical protein
MKWHHLTGIQDFTKIMFDGALLCYYEKLKKDNPNKEKEIDKIILKDSSEDLTKEGRYYRRANVFLATEFQRCLGAKGKDILLGFELNETANNGALLAVPEVSLEHLVDVGVIGKYYKQITDLMEFYNEKKHNNIFVYKINFGDL